MFTKSCIGLWLCAVVVACSLAGCASGPRIAPYDVSVSLDESLKQNNTWPTLEVDLVAIGEDEKNVWNAYSVDKYFSRGDLLRTGKKNNGEAHTMKFSNSDPTTQTLSRKDPVWTKWKNKPELYVIAYLRDYSDKSDPQGLFRRKVVPLDKRRWNNSQSIGIVVRQDGLKYTTDPLPEAK
jgi:hypothetical protein